MLNAERANPKSGVRRAFEYMVQVSRGHFPACIQVKQAVQRQINDLQSPPDGYHFSQERAEEIIQLIELLPHVKGRWSTADLSLENFQCFILTTVFGWIDDNGYRRFRKAYLRFARKNAKSTVSAGVGIYMLAADGEPGAEIVSAATTRDQARIIYDMAKEMVRREPDLRQALGLEVFGGSTQAGVIKCVKNAGTFLPLSREAGGDKDGGSPHCNLIDEFHAHKTSAMYDVLDTGTGARKQPLTWIVTTAGANKHGPCYEMDKYCESILAGHHDDERFFGIIYQLDDDDEWDDESVWIKANPGLGVCVNLEDLQSKATAAKSSVRLRDSFQTKHLNRWINASQSWMDMVRWSECVVPDEFDWSVFRGQRCWIGLDLSSKKDITAISYLWSLDDKWYTLGKYYMPDAVIHSERMGVVYKEWAEQGHLTLMSGAVIDFETVQSQIIKDASEFRVEGVAIDPWNGQQMMQNLIAEGVPVIEMRPTLGNMSEPMKTLEALVLQKKILHNNNPALSWMMSNVVAKVDDKDNVLPTKDQAENRIDGVAALISALGIGITSMEKPDAGEWYFPQVRSGF